MSVKKRKCLSDVVLYIGHKMKQIPLQYIIYVLSYMSKHSKEQWYYY